MTPHEVVKNSLEKFEKLIEYNHGNGDIILKTEVFYDKQKLKQFIIDSQLTLLLSVKEMVESRKKKEIMSDRDTMTTIHANYKTRGYNQALSDLKSILDSEINKIKEIWGE